MLDFMASGCDKQRKNLSFDEWLFGRLESPCQLGELKKVIN